MAGFCRSVGSWAAAGGRGCLMVNLMAGEAPAGTVSELTQYAREVVAAGLNA